MKIFISYSHKDSESMKYLRGGLNYYIKSKQIESWNDRDLLAGDTYTPIIKERMEESDVILLLISNNFMQSDYIMDYEIPIAVEKIKKGARIIPIILEVCPYSFLADAFGEAINEIPRTPDGNMLKPVNEWEKEAWKVITEQIIKILKNSTLANAGLSTSPQNQKIVAEQNEKIQSKASPITDGNIQPAAQPLNNIFSGSYVVPDSLVSGKSDHQTQMTSVAGVSNEYDLVFDSILNDAGNADAVQGQMTKIRLEDSEVAGISKKCVVIAALTISLLRNYSREKLLTLIDFIEDREHILWQRALAGMVLAVGNRYPQLDAQVKKKLQSLKNDREMQECITNLLYGMGFRVVASEERLYSNRKALETIDFFDSHANWFLPFNRECVPGKLVDKNPIFEYAPQAIVLKDDNIKFLTILQYDQLSATEQELLEAELEDEKKLRIQLKGDEHPLTGEADVIIKNYLAILFSYLYIKHPGEWENYKGNFPWPEELRSIALNEVYQLKANAIMADISNDLTATPALYEDFLSKTDYKDSGALKFYGYYCLYVKDYSKALSLLESAHAIDPLDVNLNLQLAFTCMSKADPDYSLALQYLQYAIVLDPLNFWCLKNIGFCLQRLAIPDNDLALKYYLEAWSIDPSDAWLAIKIGSCYQHIKEPDFNRSREFLERGIAGNNSDFSAYADLGYAYQWSEGADFQKALEYHLRAYAIDDTNLWNIRNIGFCYMKIPQPNIQKAMRYFRMALEEEPNDAWTLIKMALCYQQLVPADNSSALEYFLKAYKVDGDKSNLEKNIGICYININPPDFSTAKSFLEKALVKEPEHPDVLANLGYLSQVADPPDFPKALEYHLKAYQSDPAYTWNTKNIGHCYINIPVPDYNEALRYLSLANDQVKNDDWVLKRIGFCYQFIEPHDYEKALDYHLQAYALNAEDVWNIQSIATCYSHLPKPDHKKALEFLLIAYAKDADDPQTLTDIGACYQEIDPPDWNKALEFHLKALEVNPDDLWNLQNVGYCYEKLSEPDHEKALEYYLKAYSIKPDDATILGNIGICYQNLTPSNYEKAIEYHLRSLAIDPTNANFLREIGICYEYKEPPDFPNAYTYFTRAVEANLETDGLFEIDFGWVCILLKKFEEAEKLLLKGLNLQPEESSTYINLGHVEMFRNNIDKAKEYYKQCLEKSVSKESFVEVSRKDIDVLEPLGMNRELYLKAIEEITAE